MKILFAGFHHETNTFSPTKADYDKFKFGDGWTPMMQGDELFSLRDMNVPSGGFISAMQADGHTLVPILWAAANPSGPVTKDAFERIVNEITDAVIKNSVDAIYLDLHGAMVAEHADDGEGELLLRLRKIVGKDVPIVISLDLHANVTQKMFELADGMVAYRTYPHVDMAKTGIRSGQLLNDLVSYTGTVHRVIRRIPFLIPINGMYTNVNPAKDLYEQLGVLEAHGIFSLSFAPGFPAADFPECGPTIWGYGKDKAELTRAIDMLYEMIVQNEEHWATTFLTPDDAVVQAMRIAESATKPVVIADTQDNPGAGGASNTTGMLKALLQNGAKRAAIGLICDPETAKTAHKAGVGNVIKVKLGDPMNNPCEGTYLVESLSDGRAVFGGPMLTGVPVQLGLSACLKIDDIHVVVSSERVQMMDRNLYRMVGIQPEQMKILVNKSSVHFRADFEPIAEVVLVAKAPGVALADPGDLSWVNLQEGMRIRPLGAAFKGSSLPEM
jgi:microcystin degradation protein MlrC